MIVNRKKASSYYRHPLQHNLLLERGTLFHGLNDRVKIENKFPHKKTNKTRKTLKALARKELIPAGALKQWGLTKIYLLTFQSRK